MRRLFSKLPVLVLAVAVAGCASPIEQQAEQAEAAAAKADEAATRAEESATKALDAANKATEAADRATRAVEDATREINRVADHLEQMERDREAANSRASGLARDEAGQQTRGIGVRLGVCVFERRAGGASLGVARRVRRRIRDLRRCHVIGRGASGRAARAGSACAGGDSAAAEEIAPIERSG